MDNPALATHTTDPHPSPEEKDGTPGGSQPNHSYVDVGGHTSPGEKMLATAPYAGMGKDDLFRFSQTPFWNRLRLGCLITFWLAWLGLLVAVVVLTIVMPRCAAPPTNTWSQHTVIYDVYVPSFYDTDSDGIGDIKGVEEKLDYIRGLEVTSLALSPVYLSANDVFDDVIDHKAVDQRLGNLDDLKTLVKAAHDRSMKVLLDFIPNHTSKNHTWFKESESSNNQSANPYWNYYTWAQCAGDATPPPNNWVSVFWRSVWAYSLTRGECCLHNFLYYIFNLKVSVYGGSAWEYSPTRGECYLHNFLSDEPELNLRSSMVQEDLTDILRYWINEVDIDGFRIRSASFLFEDADLRDDGIIPGCNNLSRYGCLEHSRTRGQEENYVLINQWRKVLDGLGGQRILAVESSDGVNLTGAFYGGTALNGAQLPINVQLAKLAAHDNAASVRKLVSDWLQVTPTGGTADWASSSSEVGRQDRLPVAALHMLKMTLPGTTFNYYGEELGMRNGNHSGPATDPAGRIDLSFSRDPYRSPMQWSSVENGGFTNSTIPWLPLNDDVTQVNVEAQQSQSDSPLTLFKTLAKLRQDEGALQYGDFSYVVTTDNIISYTRQFNGQNSFLVAMNFGSVEETQNYSAVNSTIPSEAEVVLVTSGDVADKVGDMTSLTSLKLRPGDGVLVKWPYTR